MARNGAATIVEEFRSVRGRLIRALGLFAVAFAVAIGAWASYESWYARYLHERAERDRSRNTQQIVTLAAQKLTALVADYTPWDELVAFVQEQPSAEFFAAETLEPALDTYNADGIWVYRTDFSPVYGLARDGWLDTAARGPVTRALRRAKILDKRQAAFFVVVRGRVLDVRAATIHPSGDTDRLTEPQGIFIAFQEWNARHIGQLSSLTDTTMALVPTGYGDLSEEVDADNLMRYSLPLYGAAGSPVAHLVCTAQISNASDYRAISLRGLSIFFLFLLVFGLQITLQITRLVTEPLGIVARSLKKGSDAELAKLRSVHDEFGQLAGLIQDVFRQRAALQRAYQNLEARVEERTRAIRYQAYHDTLTGLPNRASFSERIRRLQSAKPDGRLAALLFIDLDNFKWVNDTMGHEAGDAVLVEAARRIAQGAPPGAWVARLGGDEFTVLVEEVVDAEEAVAIAQSIVNLMRKPLLTETTTILMPASIGVAVGLVGTAMVGELLRHADIALYEVKRRGKQACVLFDEAMHQTMIQRIELEMSLRHALDRDEFEIYYQPIISMESGEMVTVEALVRWNHSAKGWIAPSVFIPIAEENGTIVGIGEWVLRQACKQVAEWNAAFPDRPPMVVSVNLSTRQLQDDKVAERVARALQDSALPPECLQLEITESALMGDVEMSILCLHSLRALGIKLAIDDFGTGYSSMGSLKVLPVDSVKIDRAFVVGMSESLESTAIIRAIITLCRILGLKITGEGVETDDQMTILQSLGCDYGQGYLISRPLTAARLRKLMARGGPLTGPLARTHRRRRAA